MIERYIVGSEKPSEGQLFWWNMAGSAVYALASMILTYITIRQAGAVEGGVFAIGLTLAQMFVYIAYYEMRNFQVTDIGKTYIFADYHGVKILNCIIMIGVCLIYCIVKHYDTHKLLIVILVCLYRMLDGYADVYEADFHNSGRLDLAGKSMCFRTVISVSVYFCFLWLTHSLLVAMCGAVISGLLGIYIYDILVMKCIGDIEISWDKRKMARIWKECFPLFIGMFLWTYLLSASRMAVDDVMSSDYQSYYQVLFLPVSVINLFAGFIIRPSMNSLAEYHVKGLHNLFWKKVLGIFGLISFFTILCMAGAYVCGIPVLNLLAGCNLSEFRMLFVFLIFAGGVNAAAYLLYSVLLIYRSAICVLSGYIIASILAFFISTQMVRKYALWGAGISYLVSVFLLAMLFVICIILLEKRK